MTFNTSYHKVSLFLKLSVALIHDGISDEWQQVIMVARDFKHTLDVQCNRGHYLRAKIHWLQLGDAPTKYFFHILCQRRAKNYIGCLRLPNGSKVSDTTQIAYAFMKHFQSIMRTSHHAGLDYLHWLLTFIPHTLSCNQMVRPEHAFMDEELFSALMTLASDASWAIWYKCGLL